MFIETRMNWLKKGTCQKFQSLLNTRHCSSKMKKNKRRNRQEKVSILTQYKALFINTKKLIELLLRLPFQSLLNTRHCSSLDKDNLAEKVRRICFNPYSIQGIVHLKNLIILDEPDKRFNPYSIQGIVHPWQGAKYKKGNWSRFNPYSIQGIVHPNGDSKLFGIFPDIVSILTQYKALFIWNEK